MRRLGKGAIKGRNFLYTRESKVRKDSQRLGFLANAIYERIGGMGTKRTRKSGYNSKSLEGGRRKKFKDYPAIKGVR